jgi:lysophospholipase L1-like esterase
VEPSQDVAQDGTTAMKETLEDAHGLSVLWVELEAYPKATYRASAWVYVPAREQAASPCLSFNRMDWSPLASATTAERDTWVRLEVECQGGGESRVRLQLFQDGQKAGLGGAVMYWDNVTVERELAATKMEDGMRINPHVQDGLDVTPAGGLRVRVAPGRMEFGGQVVEVTEETVLELAAPRVIQVRDEAKRLTDQVPQSYHGGTALQQCTIEGGIGLAGALAPESLVVKAEAGPDGMRLEEGKDWRADRLWGRIGRLPDGAIGAETTVYVDYDWGLQRVDTIEVRSDGRVVLRPGAEDKTIPAPPPTDQFAQALCNVFLPFHCKEITPELVYPIGPPFPSATQGEVERNAALIPGTLEKLQRGGQFTLLFWGDSVTCGGSASIPAKAFPQAFTTWLRDRYPQTSIRYVNAGTGGWNSDSKLPLFQSEVLDQKPDLVVIEFVNDMGMDRARIFRNYTEAVSRLRELGAEVILLTPHFVRPDWMGAGADMRTPETRAAVGFLKEFASENRVGLADASRRWAHLWVEGLPYLTLEYNAINHPDDRGHRLFVEELQKFFP